MSDLVRGKYAVTAPIVKMTGGLSNVSQGNIAARSNAEMLGLAGLADTSAALTTAVCTAVAIPVEYGDVISKVTVLAGATGAGTPLNSWAALYSGVAVPALLAQSVDGATAAIAASAGFTFTLATPQTVTPTNAPGGFWYVSVMVKATTVPSLATVSVAAAVGYKAFTNAPLFFAATHGSALTTTAPATIATPTAQTAVPIVFAT